MAKILYVRPGEIERLQNKNGRPNGVLAEPGSQEELGLLADGFSPFVEPALEVPSPDPVPVAKKGS